MKNILGLQKTFRHFQLGLAVIAKWLFPVIHSGSDSAYPVGFISVISLHYHSA